MKPIALAIAALLATAASPAGVEVTISGPQGALAGTLLDPAKDAPAILMIPGSGPTDRDGNNPLGVKGGVYRQLAEGLAAKGVATLRIDKRGLFGSKAAVADPNDVTIAAYAADAHAWVDMLRAKTGRSCVWLLGHSEGSLVALKAAQEGAQRAEAQGQTAIAQLLQLDLSLYQISIPLRDSTHGRGGGGSR